MNSINKARHLLLNGSLKDMEGNKYLIPYCARLLSSGSVIFLNRDYKLIGTLKEVKYTFVDYDSFEPIAFDGKAVPELSEQNYQHYFYSDSDTPWDSHEKATSVLCTINDIAVNYAKLVVNH